MTVMPAMYGRNATGISTVPSSRWKFSRIATIIRGTAHAVAFSVCANSVGTFFAFPFLSAPSSSFATGLQGSH